METAKRLFLKNKSGEGFHWSLTQKLLVIYSKQAVRTWCHSVHAALIKHNPDSGQQVKADGGGGEYVAAGGRDTVDSGRHSEHGQPGRKCRPFT